MNPSKHLAGIAPPLLSWYQENARSLPWRVLPSQLQHHADIQQHAYAVWVSEIMLQQTRVDTVIPYFNHFMETLPSVSALAGVEDQQLLKLWQGLGYYSRAKNLKRAANAIVEQHDGIIPSDYKQLVALPGIGEYTASAILSIGFNLPYAAVDGNLLRVLSRYTASDADITLPATKRLFTKELQQIMPSDFPGDFNQALMDVGATICLPNGAPRCEVCPLQSGCIAYRKNLTDQLPVKSEKRARKLERRTVFLIVVDNSVALQQRPDAGLLANLYQYPNIGQKLGETRARQQLNNWGVQIKKLTRLPDHRHIFTHIEWQLTCYLVQAVQIEDDAPFDMVPIADLTSHYPMPKAFSQLNAYLPQIIL